MAQKNRKTHKKRGSRTHGYGNAQKHRGAGSRGGRGRGGSNKQKWSYFSKYVKGHFGHKGFKRPQSTISSPLTLNVGALSERVSELEAQGAVEKKGKKTTIDLSKAGVDKLLGAGRVDQPFTVIVSAASTKAREKIEAAGGAIEGLAEQGGVEELSESDDRPEQSESDEG